ncbi:MAG: flagellar filament capping protein FliD [Gammaproteobacteria bacterium]|jgi:flagellar hook-associated protein 2
MISSPGLGSGLDVSSLVEQLVSIERQPLVRLARKEVGYQAQISAYGSLRSALSTFESSLNSVNTLSDFRVLTAKSSDEGVFGASAGSSAAKGTYSLTVDRIAENHRLGSNAFFADTDTTSIGSEGETLTITQGGDSFDVAYGGKTLAEVRALINEASGNTGVTASILKDDLGSRLLLSADDTGSDNFVTTSYSGADAFAFATLNTDRDGDLSVAAADLDAVLSIDGVFTATRSTNTIKDVVQGVTINLVAAGTSTLTVNDDVAAVENSVQKFVDAYNTALTTIRSLREGALNDDANSLFAIENQIRQVFNSPLSDNGTYSSIYEVGISSTFVLGGASQDNGKLNLDASALRDALNEDRDSVATLFADPNKGLIPQLESLLSGLVDFEGFIDGKTDSLNRRIDSIGVSRESMTRRIDSYEARLLKEFNSLDTLVAQLQVSGNFLQQQLSLLQPTNNK